MRSLSFSHRRRSSGIFFLLLLVFVTGQGCFVWRYTVIPPVSGKVVDAATGTPVAGAVVGFRKHEKKLSVSFADGTFCSRPDAVWRPCYFLPGEFWPSGGTFFVEAPGYQVYEQEIHTTMGQPFTIAQPVALKRQ